MSCSDIQLQKLIQDLIKPCKISVVNNNVFSLNDVRKNGNTLKEDDLRDATENGSRPSRTYEKSVATLTSSVWVSILHLLII